MEEHGDQRLLTVVFFCGDPTAIPPRLSGGLTAFINSGRLPVFLSMALIATAFPSAGSFVQGFTAARPNGETTMASSADSEEGPIFSIPRWCPFLSASATI